MKEGAAGAVFPLRGGRSRSSNITRSFRVASRAQTDQRGRDTPRFAFGPPDSADIPSMEMEERWGPRPWRGATGIKRRHWSKHGGQTSRLPATRPQRIRSNDRGTWPAVLWGDDREVPDKQRGRHCENRQLVLTGVQSVREVKGKRKGFKLCVAFVFYWSGGPAQTILCWSDNGDWWNICIRMELIPEIPLLSKPLGGVTPFAPQTVTLQKKFCLDL